MFAVLLATAFLAGQATVSTSNQSSSARLPDNEPVLEVPVRIVHILDSQGNAELFGNIHTVMTLQIAKDQLSAINDIYAPWKIRYTLASNDFETRRDDYLNLDSNLPERTTVEAPQTAKPLATGVAEHQRAFEKLANERPDRMTMIVHRGSEWRWNARKRLWEFAVGFSRGGNWFAKGKGAYVRICGTKPRVWAHELGHSLGLPHTSRDGVDAPSKLVTSEDISAACEAYLAKGGDPKHPEYAIDGDYQVGVTDTPPDPGLGFWGNSKEMTRVIELRLRGREPFRLLVSCDNIMGNAEGQIFTYSQAALMRTRIKAWLKKP